MSQGSTTGGADTNTEQTRASNYRVKHSQDTTFRRRQAAQTTATRREKETQNSQDTNSRRRQESQNTASRRQETQNTRSRRRQASQEASSRRQEGPDTSSRRRQVSQDTGSRRRPSQATSSRSRPSQDTGTRAGRSSKSVREARKGSRASASDKMGPHNLEQELEEQRKYRDTVSWSVGVLEQSVAELQLQLDSLTRGNTDDADTEFKLRYEAQEDLNEKLKEQTEWYSEELTKTKDRFRQAQQRASYNLTTLCQEYSYDAGLDQYTEAELSVLVRQLERERNISYSEFRNKTWLLDSRSKEYHQLKDLCDAYSGDLSFVNRSLEEMWRKRSTSGHGAYGTAAAGVLWNGESGFSPTQRVLDPRHGPVRKTAGVRSLPRLDPAGLSSSQNSGGARRANRTRSLDERGRRKRMAAEAHQRHKSAHVLSNDATHTATSALDLATPAGHDSEHAGLPSPPTGTAQSPTSPNIPSEGNSETNLNNSLSSG